MLREASRSSSSCSVRGMVHLLGNLAQDMRRNGLTGTLAVDQQRHQGAAGQSRGIEDTHRAALATAFHAPAYLPASAGTGDYRTRFRAVGKEGHESAVLLLGPVIGPEPGEKDRKSVV